MKGASTEKGERFRDVVEQSHEGIVITDADGLLRWVNPAWERMTGWTLAEVVGRTPGAVLQGARHDPELRQRMRRAFDARTSFSESLVNVRRDGSAFWTRIFATPLLDPDGTVRAWVGIKHDISESVDREEALRAERAFAQSLIASTPDGLFALDRAGRVTEWNPTLAAWTGRAASSVVGRPLDEVAPEWADELQGAPLERLLREGQPWRYERSGLLATRGIRRLDVMAAPIRDPESGEIRGAVCTVRDVEARFSAEEKLRASEARSQAVVQNAATLLVGLRTDGTIFEWNTATERLFGRTRAEVLGRRYVDDFVPPASRATVLADIDRVLSGTPSVDFVNDIVGADGVVSTVRWNVTRIVDRDAQPEGVIAVGEDVSERVQATERFRILFESSSDPHLLFDSTGVIECNAAAVRLLRAADANDVIGLHPATLSPATQPDGRRSAEAALEMIELARTRGHHRFDWVHQRFDGTTVPIEVSLTPVTLRGRPTMLVVWHELTERRAAEEALARERARLVDAIESLDAGFAMFDADERLLAWNRTFAREHSAWTALVRPGISLSTLLESTLVEGRHAFTGEDGATWIARSRARHHGAGEVHEEQYAQRTLRVSVLPTSDGGSVSLATDVTPLKEIQRSLEQARDIARDANSAKSEFLARMSHELRTPLNSIIGFTRQVRTHQSHALTPKYRLFLDRVEANGVHLLGLINSILDLSRIEAGKVTVERHPVDLRALVSEVVALLDGQPRRASVSLSTTLPVSPSFVHTDAAKLRQVLINLVGNAIKFTHAGSVTVTLTGDGRTVPFEIAVRDTGIGIAPSRLDAVFHPFEQATSSTGRDYGGTGLGLTIVRSLCELLGAQLHVTSTVGVGTTFIVQLSLVDDTRTSAQPPLRVDAP